MGNDAGSDWRCVLEPHAEGRTRAPWSRGTIGGSTINRGGPPPCGVPIPCEFAPPDGARPSLESLSWLVVLGLVVDGPPDPGHDPGRDRVTRATRGGSPSATPTDEPTGTPTDHPTGTPTDDTHRHPDSAADRDAEPASDDGPPVDTPSQPPSTPTERLARVHAAERLAELAPRRRAARPSSSPSGSPTFSPTSTVETETGTPGHSKPGHTLPPTDGLSDAAGVARSGVSIALLVLAALLTAALFITPSWAKPTDPKDRR